MDIPAERRQAARVGFLFQVITGLLGLSLTGLVVLGTRRYTRLVQARRRAADEQARSSTQFGAKLESIIGSCVDIAGAITSSDDPLRILQLIADEAREVGQALFERSDLPFNVRVKDLLTRVERQLPIGR